MCAIYCIFIFQTCWCRRDIFHNHSSPILSFLYGLISWLLGQHCVHWLRSHLLQFVLLFLKVAFPLSIQEGLIHLFNIAWSENVIYYIYLNCWFKNIYCYLLIKIIWITVHKKFYPSVKNFCNLSINALPSSTKNMTSRTTYLQKFAATFTSRTVASPFLNLG